MFCDRRGSIRPGQKRKAAARVARNRRLNQPDGIHPTPAGHRILARTVWTVLQPLLTAGRIRSNVDLADARTRDDIIAQLGLPADGLVISGFDRPNIRYTIIEKHSAREQLLRFIEEMHDLPAMENGVPSILVGDLNIAPLETDVWSHKQLLDVVSHTPIEVEALGRLQAAHDWVDLGRRFIPAPERGFTWWSYRSKDWTANDRGRRLDHMWASREVADKAVSHKVCEPCRSWLKPSDHVPLVTEFDF